MRGPDLTRTTISGYEMVASRLSQQPSAEQGKTEEHIIPLYRRFDGLNHRILLHLQDEIAEMEEELRLLDECIVQMDQMGPDCEARPASRRADTRYGSEVHYRRTELLGRIFLKLGQYNQALSSYGSMIKTFEPARTNVIRNYQSWMKKHTPIDRSEARFLNHESDLLAVTPQRATNDEHNTSRYSALGIVVALLLPLLAFVVMSGALGRLFVAAIIGVSEAAVVVYMDLTSLMPIQEWITCGAV
ncbi:hypothetical protein H2201_002067 [Coniosporium apollinis]|uniref:DUF6594 domain-containing protein n=1 Tax=Coniosporium apollinis TaxID=61459 RepID=A0ABQ9P3I0_9PEZI|nr:hypothetical protein H2201_002067 [Coniosporium apollinis]